MPELLDLPIRSLAAQVARGEVSARQLAEFSHSRIAVSNPRINAILAECDLRGDAIEGKLAGVPIVVKDNICTKGVRTTCGSRILPDFVPPYHATVVRKLLAEGATIVGKANCDEFAMGSSTENSGYGPTRNPWDTERVPGGSSGGSAAAVAAGMCSASLGSDTGGSIRQPAAFCGVVGLKPTYGRVSRYGLVAYASSLDQIGPIARTVEDCAVLLEAIAGDDPLDSTSVGLPVPSYLGACERGAEGLRIGMPREYFGAGIDAEVAERVRAAVGRLCEMGATAGECSLPATEYALAAYYIIAPAEASSNLARYDGVRFGHRSKDWVGHIGMMEKTRAEGFGDEVKQRIMVGTYALSAGYYDAYYKRAQQVRTLIRRDFDRAFEQFDVLATPTAPTVAFRIGEKTDDPLAMKLADICTIPVNMAGLPALSVPCGLLGGLPVGLQLIGKPFGEETLFAAAAALEAAGGFGIGRLPGT